MNNKLPNLSNQIDNPLTALSIISQAIKIGQKSGCYELEDSVTIYHAIVFLETYLVELHKASEEQKKTQMQHAILQQQMAQQAQQIDSITQVDNIHNLYNQEEKDYFDNIQSELPVPHIQNGRSHKGKK